MFNRPDCSWSTLIDELKAIHSPVVFMCLQTGALCICKHMQERVHIHNAGHKCPHTFSHCPLCQQSCWFLKGFWRPGDLFTQWVSQRNSKILMLWTSTASTNKHTLKSAENTQIRLCICAGLHSRPVGGSNACTSWLDSSKTQTLTCCCYTFIWTETLSSVVCLAPLAGCFVGQTRCRSASNWELTAS